MQDIKKLIEEAQTGSKYPSFSVIGHRKLSEAESTDFVLKNDTFLQGCFIANYAGNTRLLSELFNRECGFYNLKKKFEKTFFPQVTNLEMYSARYMLAGRVFEEFNYRSGTSFHLSCIQSSSLSFSTWFNVNTGEIKGWCKSRTKWPSSDSIYNDFMHIASNCSYVDMTVTLWDDQLCMDSDDRLKPVISINIKDGQLELAETNLDEHKSFHPSNEDLSPSFMPEFGVSLDYYRMFTSEVKNRINEREEAIMSWKLEGENG